MNTKKPRNNVYIFRNRSIVAALVLFLLISLCSYSYNKRAKTLNQGDCISTLTSSSLDAEQTIESDLQGGLNSMKIIARLIEKNGSLAPEDVAFALSVYETNSVSTSIAVLLPDDTIINSEGKTISADGIMSYGKESAHGQHLKAMKSSVFNKDKRVIVGFVPIIIDNQVSAMLFNEIDPNNAEKKWAPDMYDGEAKYCIADRSDGAVMINTCDAVKEHIYELHNEHLVNEITSAKNGFMAFPINGQLTFCCYIPMKNADWEVIFFVSSEQTLAASNRMKKNFHSFLIEECIVFLFFMIWIFYFNKSSIKNTEENANCDVLTGLKNRNMYEAYIRDKSSSVNDLACIYIDVNGLHEVNNTRGHLAGDQMLRFVADTLKVTFSGSEIFRIGGDEFIVFHEKSSGSGIDLKLRSVNDQLRNNNYHISTGISFGSKDESINSIVKKAEERMFENKKQFYADRGRQVRNDISNKE